MAEECPYKPSEIGVSIKSVSARPASRGAATPALSLLLKKSFLMPMSALRFLSPRCLFHVRAMRPGVPYPQKRRQRANISRTLYYVYKLYTQKERSLNIFQIFFRGRLFRYGWMAGRN
jgi:hypothetical protein